MEGGSLAKQTQFSDLEDLKFGGNDTFSFDPRLLGSKAEQEQQGQLSTDFRDLDGLCLDHVVSLPFQSFQEDITKFPSCQFENSGIVEPKNEILNSRFAVLGTVNDSMRRCRRVEGKKLLVPIHERARTKVTDPKLSTYAIIRLAGKRFIQSRSGRIDDLSQLGNPFACSFIGLSDEESRNVELVQDLLACAEKVSQQQFDSANKLIWQFINLSYSKGNPVQRLVYYCADALREKLIRKRGENKHNSLGKRQVADLQETLMSANLSIIAFHERVPFSKVCQFTFVQTILENVRKSRMIHIIDFEIRNGMQWTVLMEALAARCGDPLRRLRITAVGTRSKSTIEETGERLKNFAQSMNLPFSFNIVMVENMLDLNNVDLLELNHEEEVAVYLPFLLSTLIAQPDHLDCLMSVIKHIKPCITALSEVEANHISRSFVNRFIEALFYYSSFFDCVSDCMADEEQHRKVLEATYGVAIKNILAAEGEERIFRHIKVDVWRMYFARFGLVPTELSSASQYQAEMLIKHFACGSSCTLDMDKKRLIVGWKGEPIFSVSAWKFL